MAHKIIDLNNINAQNYLMQPSHYCTTELPTHFKFGKILNSIKRKIGEKSFEECTLESLKDIANPNFEILTNKDGHYGVRPITLTNPFLYIFMVNTLCEKKAWKAITKAFDAFKCPNIKACSIPVIKDAGEKEDFMNATTVLNWWAGMEQGALKLSLKYKYMFMSDISNCFGEIDLQSFDWALSRRDTDLATNSNHLLAKKIINILTAMNGGRNIGIPQGSTLYSFLAEIVLGYADLLLDRAIRKAGINEPYHILRYVDDYRIFCNNKETLEEISFMLQEILEKLHLRINSSKTRISDSIVMDALKPDKAFYIFNTPILNKKGVDFDGLQKHLFFIFEFGRKYPNSGQLKRQLSDFSKRLARYIPKTQYEKNAFVEGVLTGKSDISKEEERAFIKWASRDDYPCSDKNSSWAEVDLSDEEDDDNNVFKKLGFKKVGRRKPKIKEEIPPMIAILTQIAADNVAAAHYALRIISQLLSTVEDSEEKTKLIADVYHKLKATPNSNYIQLWLQVLTYSIKKKELNIYESPLCQLVKKTRPQLWNCDWLLPELAKALSKGNIFDKKELAATEQRIYFDEIVNYSGASL